MYDLENGEVTDLNVTVGPPGREIPPSPWPSTEVREKEKRAKWEAKVRKDKEEREREKTLMLEDKVEVSQRPASV